MNLRFHHYMPEKIVSNNDLENQGMLSLSGKPLTAERIYNITGIKTRRVATEEESTLYMAYKAFEGVLGDSNPDAVLTSTSYPAGVNFSAEIVKRFSLSGESTHIMDFYAACSGFARQLKYIYDNMDIFEGKDVILVNTEKYSGTLQGLDKAIFTDGAIASRFRVGEDLVIKNCYSVNRDMFTEEVNMYIQMPIDRKMMISPCVEEFVPVPSEGSNPNMFYQNGEGVKIAVLTTLPGIVRMMDDEYVRSANGNKPLRKLIPHQGSKQIVDREIARSLPEYDVIRDYEDGNGSSMSIPRAIMRLAQREELSPGEEFLIAGFGAGMHLTVVKLRLG